MGLSGSLREKSYSRVALREALRIAVAEGGAATELLDVRKLNLPMFVPNLPVREYPAVHQMSNERAQRRLARLVNELLDFA